MSVIVYKDYRLICDVCMDQAEEPWPGSTMGTARLMRKRAKNAGWQVGTRSNGPDRCPQCVGKAVLGRPIEVPE